MTPDVVFATSTDDAVRRLADAGADGAPLAGGTWIMRAGLRGERHPALYVSLDRVAGLRDVTVGDDLLAGACATHAGLAAALAGEPRLAGLHDAAARSANPSVRAAATIGGALATADFPASDIVTALLALDAEVLLARPGATEHVALGAFLAARDQQAAGVLITGVRAGLPARSAHARLTLRAAGDYPVAIASVAEVADGLRIAIGSVEPVPRRWAALEDALDGTDPAAAVTTARELAGDLAPRDGVDAPGWYRAQVLPALVGRAMEALA